MISIAPEDSVVRELEILSYQLHLVSLHSAGNWPSCWCFFAVDTDGLRVLLQALGFKHVAVCDEAPLVCVFQYEDSKERVDVYLANSASV